MSFKSKIQNAKNAVVDFCNHHKTGIGITAAAIGGSMVGGSIVWFTGKMIEAEKAGQQLNAEMAVAEENRRNYIDMLSHISEGEWDDAWNSDWAMFEHTTRQIQNLEGKAWVIAGESSFYNSDPDSVGFYVVDESGTWHCKNDDIGMYA